MRPSLSLNSLAEGLQNLFAPRYAIVATNTAGDTRYVEQYCDAYSAHNINEPLPIRLPTQPYANYHTRIGAYASLWIYSGQIRRQMGDPRTKLSVKLI